MNRSQQVILNGSASKTFSVSSGEVSSGRSASGLCNGAPVILVYVNDIPEQVGCNVSMFADDTKIYTTIKTLLIPINCCKMV